MTDVIITHNTVTVCLSGDAVRLAARYADLLRMPEDDPELLAALWEALAQDYQEVYPNGSMVQRSRRKSDHYRSLANHPPVA